MVVPAAREDLTATVAGGETLLYDERRHHIHHLNPVSTAVWGLCDGTRTINGITRETGLDFGTVRLALLKLADADLLAGKLAPDLSVKSPGRRRWLKKAGIAAIPAIVSVTAPLGTAHASEGECVNPGGGAPGSFCFQHFQCCSASCNFGMQQCN